MHIHFYTACGQSQTGSVPDEAQSGAAHALKLPGRMLNLAAITHHKKFRNFGWKPGTIKAFNELESAGLGLQEVTATKAGRVRFHT